MDRRTFLGGAIAGSAAAASAANGNGEIKSASFVVVEMMGYKKLCGRMTQGPAGLLQLDIPAPGGFITQFINPQSVYRITICDEKTVKEMAKSIDPLPSIELEVPARQTYLDYDSHNHDEDF